MKIFLESPPKRVKPIKSSAVFLKHSHDCEAAFVIIGDTKYKIIKPSWLKKLWWKLTFQGWKMSLQMKVDRPIRVIPEIKE